MSEHPPLDPMDPRILGALALLLGILATCLSIFVTRQEFSRVDDRLTYLERLHYTQAPGPPR
jgi:hypothetical protein